MRIIFLADVHSAFRNVEMLMEKAEADLYLITGDLVSRSFFRYSTAWRFMELQQELEGYRKTENLEETLDRLCLHIQKSGKDHPYFSKAKEYIALSGQAERYLKKSYQRLSKIFEKYPEKRAYVIPGNYDMELSLTALKERDIHFKSIQVNGLRVAGLGGADVKTPGMPDHLQVPYFEAYHNDTMVEFLRISRPDILVLHQPPYGYLDLIPGQGNAGNVSLRDFLDKDESNIKVVFTGHHHDQWGAVLAEGVLFSNPSNFGSTAEISGLRLGGFFLDLKIDESGVELATIRRLEKDGIYDIVDYLTDGERLETLILDEERHKLLGGKTSKKQHIQPIRQFRKIRSFFLNYETPESVSLINELRSIYRSIKDKGMEVAFDLLGSISFGIAHESSDMDLVVYMRSRDCVLDEEDTCGVPRPLAAVFDALKKRHLEVEVCDSLDLDRIIQAIDEEDAEDGQLQRFVFYRLVCRPVNLRVIKRVENLLFKKEHFRKKVEKGLEEYIRVLVSSVRHVKSFEKYKTRIKERGIDIPPDVEEAIRNYLRG